MADGGAHRMKESIDLGGPCGIGCGTSAHDDAKVLGMGGGGVVHGTCDVAGLWRIGTGSTKAQGLGFSRIELGSRRSTEEAEGLRNNGVAIRNGGGVDAGVVGVLVAEWGGNSGWEADGTDDACILEMADMGKERLALKDV